MILVPYEYLALLERFNFLTQQHNWFNQGNPWFNRKNYKEII